MTTKPPPSANPPSVPPPVDSGSGKYLLIILLLGAGMAGLFFWRRSQTEPPMPGPVATVAPKVTPPPTHEEPLDIPPPPPAVPDATPDTGGPAKTPTTAVYTGGDGCAQTSCSGQAGEALQSALAFRGRTAHKCYDEALGQDPTLKGNVTIGIKVSGNGTVCSASVGSSDLANPGVATCIANRYRQGARLPSPTGGCVEINVPMKLLPAH